MIVLPLQLLPFGDVLEGREPAAVGRAMKQRVGERVVVRDVVIVENAPRKGNLIARLRGKPATKKPIMLLAHLDVVEAKPEALMRRYATTRRPHPLESGELGLEHAARLAAEGRVGRWRPGQAGSPRFV